MQTELFFLFLKSGPPGPRQRLGGLDGQTPLRKFFYMVAGHTTTGWFFFAVLPICHFFPFFLLKSNYDVTSHKIPFVQLIKTGPTLAVGTIKP